MAFNDQLAAIIEADVPLDLGLGRSAGETADALGKINSLVARRVSRGASLAEAIEDNEPPLPAAYRSLVHVGLLGGDLQAGLDGSTRLAASIDEARHGARSSLIYPLVVCCLALAGMIGFCLYYVPTLENLHGEFRIPAGWGLAALQVLRDWLPYWSALLPIVALATVWQFRRGSQPGSSPSCGQEFWRRVTGASLAIDHERYANFAESLAALASAGMSVGESLRLAAGTCGDVGLSQDAAALADAMSQGKTPPEDAASLRRIPPFLQWALLRSEPAVQRPRALRMAAEAYRESADRQIERTRFVTPMVACVLLGGGATLLYGLALFVPVVDLLTAMSLPPGS